MQCSGCSQDGATCSHMPSLNISYADEEDNFVWIKTQISDVFPHKLSNGFWRHET